MKDPYKIIEMEHKGKTYCLLLDHYDWKRLRKYKWKVNFAGGRKRKKVPQPYARAYIKEFGCRKYAHQLIKTGTVGMHIDHLNHQTLDCRGKNLEVITPEENMKRRRKK